MTDEREGLTVKKVIVMRHDLNMRKGKMVAQGSHASTGVVLEMQRHQWERSIPWDSSRATPHQLQAISAWLGGQFSKICVRVDSEDDLIRVYDEAVRANLPVYLVTDSGRTEFHGVPTRTCLAIGPCWSEDVDPITSNLKLL